MMRGQRERKFRMESDQLRLYMSRRAGEVEGREWINRERWRSVNIYEQFRGLKIIFLFRHTLQL